MRTLTVTDVARIGTLLIRGQISALRLTLRPSTHTGLATSPVGPTNPTVGKWWQNQTTAGPCKRVPLPTITAKSDNEY